MADQDSDKEQEQELSPEAEPSPQQEEEQEPAQPSRPSRPKSEAEEAAAKAETRRFHLERALKASGRASAKRGSDGDGDEGDGEDADDEDDSDKGDKAAAKGKAKDGEKDDDEKESPKGKRLPLDKIKNGAHVRKAKEKLATDYADLEKREKTHRDKVAEDERINAAADRKYGEMARAEVSYKNKDYRTTAAALKNLLGDDISTVARNIYGATKDGMAVADLRHEITTLKEALSKQEKTDTAEKEKQTTASEEKRERATFDKRIKGHDLTALGDVELSNEAWKAYYDSWDDDLEEYALTPKQAADKVLERERVRAERISGRRIARPAVTRETRGPRETRDGASDAKPLASMSKAEKTIYFRDRAIRLAGQSRRQRERQA